jgi:hypothetical protein
LRVRRASPNRESTPSHLESAALRESAAELPRPPRSVLASFVSCRSGKTTARRLTRP